jgi:5'-nucleotidase
MHAGDLLYPSVMSKYLKAEPMVQALNLLDGDPDAFDPGLIAVFGNHEFDPIGDKGPEEARDIFLARMVQCDFRWVSSNVFYKAPGASTLPMYRRFANVHDTIVVVEDGIAIGILGLTHDARKVDYVGYTYDRAERRTLVSQALRDLTSRGARVLVALTHQDMVEDVWLAREFPELDLIVGGQEHYYQLRKVGPTWITKADSDAKSVIVIDVLVPPTGRASISPARKELRDAVARDSVLDDHARRSLDLLKQAYEAAAKAKGSPHFDLNETLATTENLLEGDEAAVRGRETALGNFLTDIIREHMHTNIAFINGGGLRLNDNIPAGSAITNYHMEGIFFYDDRLVTFSITRDQLLDVLKNAVSQVHLGDGRFLQVSGLKFQYHKKGDPGDPSYEIRPEEVEVLIDSPPRYVSLSSADGKGPFTVATVEFLWARGSEDGYTLFSAKNKDRPARTDNPANPVSFRKMTEAYFADLTKAGKRVTAKKEGRIVEVSP